MTSDADDRTTAIGLYNYACSYHSAAQALSKATFKATHKEAPTSFLYFHAIELFLKAYLRIHGHSVREIKGTFGHSIERMRKRAKHLGFDFMDEDSDVLTLMEDSDIVIGSRYIRTGYKDVPTIEALERTAKSFRETTHDAARSAGLMVRR